MWLVVFVLVIVAAGCVCLFRDAWDAQAPDVAPPLASDADAEHDEYRDAA